MTQLTVGKLVNTFNRIFFILPDVPRNVQIEITNVCNLSCPMCPRLILKVPIRHMDFPFFEKILKNLEGVQSITLTGWGEPLTHPKIAEMIKLSKDMGFKVGLTTNGTLLDDEMQERLIKSGLDNLSVSLDSIEEVNKFAHNNLNAVENLRKLMNKDHNIDVSIQSTIHKGREKDLVDVLNFAIKNGIKKLILMRLYSGFNFGHKLPKPTYEEEKKIFKKLEKMGEKHGVQVDFYPIRVGRGLSRFAYNYLKYIYHRFNRYCKMIYDFAYVTIDGKVSPCCLLRNITVGDLTKNTIKEIWKSKQYNAFRENQRRICSRIGCDIEKVI